MELPTRNCSGRAAPPGEAWWRWRHISGPGNSSGCTCKALRTSRYCTSPPRIQAWRRRCLASRRRGGGKLIPATASGLRQLYAHIRSGEGRGRAAGPATLHGAGPVCPVFRHPALTGVLVPRLVQRTGCIVLATVCERLEGGRFRVHLMAVDEEIYSEDMVTSLTAMNRAIERCIAIAPAQYLWSYRRFKTQPEGLNPSMIPR